MSNRRSSGVLCLGPKHREGLMDVLKGARPSRGCQHLCGHVHRCLGLTIKPLCSVPSSTSCFFPPNASAPSMHTKLFTSCCLHCWAHFDLQKGRTRSGVPFCPRTKLASPPCWHLCLSGAGRKTLSQRHRHQGVIITNKGKLLHAANMQRDC